MYYLLSLEWNMKPIKTNGNSFSFNLNLNLNGKEPILP